MTGFLKVKSNFTILYFHSKPQKMQHFPKDYKPIPRLASARGTQTLSQTLTVKSSDDEVPIR